MQGPPMMQMQGPCHDANARITQDVNARNTQDANAMQGTYWPLNADIVPDVEMWKSGSFQIPIA